MTYCDLVICAPSGFAAHPLECNAPTREKTLQKRETAWTSQFELLLHQEEIELLKNREPTLLREKKMHILFWFEVAEQRPIVAQ